MATEVERELCKICANYGKTILSLQDGSIHHCGIDERRCSGFVPANIPKEGKR